jgi:hypothetical protein
LIDAIESMDVRVLRFVGSRVYRRMDFGTAPS